MTHSVGLRTYQVFITQKRDNTFIPLGDSSLRTDFASLLKEFVTTNSSTKNLSEIEKSWKFNPCGKHDALNFEGTISYGRYGFAASLVDVKTGKESYRRKRTDSEVLKLYFRLWVPEGERFAIAAFESFSGRSCITLVFDALKQLFDEKNPGYTLRIRKLMPAGASAKIYAGKQIKNVSLTTRKPPNDLADRLFSGKAQKTKRMTVKIYAGRNDRLGEFSDLVNALPADSSGVLVYDGIEFDKAVADVKVGKEIKTVGFSAHMRKLA